MTPETMIVEHESKEQAALQEQFIRQVDDHSLPAQQILTDQQLQESDGSQRLFVP